MAAIGDILKTGAEILKGANIENASMDAWYLFERAFRITKSEYYMHMQREADSSSVSEFFNLIEQRKNRRPLQHLLGDWEFMGINFKVNENVLIPRPETELLVEKALVCIQEQNGASKVLDLCTGSGCIAVSIAKMAGISAEVHGSDISAEALQVAKENALVNRCNIRWIHSNLFENINCKYHVIVSNPPYIPTDMIPELMPEVRDYEPLIALDGGRDGLDFYRQITKGSTQFLESGGWLLYEIGHNQGKDTTALLIDNGFVDVVVLKDLAGLDRVVLGKWECAIVT